MRGRRSLLLDSYPSAPSSWASSERVRSADSVGALGLPSIFLSAALGRCQGARRVGSPARCRDHHGPDSASAGRPRDAEARAARAVPDTGSGGGPRKTGPPPHSAQTGPPLLAPERAPGRRGPRADLLCNGSGAGLLSSRAKVLPYPLIGRPGLAPLRLETRTGTFPAARVKVCLLLFREERRTAADRNRAPFEKDGHAQLDGRIQEAA
jgi:hypothetical protein